MKILILGAGAVGGYFGAAMQLSGLDVTFLVRPGRAQALAKDLLRLESDILGKQHLTVKTLTPDQAHKETDLLLLTCKAYDLEEAITTITPFIGKETIILPLLNGMAHLDRLKEQFGPAHLLGGSCKIFADLSSEGRITQTGQVAEITYGLLRGQDRLPEPVRAAERLKEVLAPVTGFTAKRTDPIERALWDKWVLLAPLAAMTCLMRGNVGEIIATDQGATLMRRAVAEACAIAAANDSSIDPAHRAAIEDLLTKEGSPFAASMFKDMQKGKRIEAGHVIGDLLARARDVKASLFETAYCHLQVYEQQLKPGMS